MRAPIGLTMAAALLVVSMPAVAAAQEPRSVQGASALTALLDARGLDAVAARDPDNPRRFVAALYFPGTQLLMVSGEYPVPVLLEQRLARGEFRQAYLDLQGASRLEGRLFVQDLQANGLRPACATGEPFDVVYQSGKPYATFNGDWAAQGLSEAEYKSRFAAADEQYARMLRALAAALRPET
jgi:hypothetical protein